MPVIGLFKMQLCRFSGLYQPTFNEAAEVIEAGAYLAAIDATLQHCPNAETVGSRK